jgi:gas vesicle protein
MLPAEKKASFDAYLKNIDVNNSYKRYDKESAVKISDISSLTSEIPKMFSSSVRENYEKKLNSPERDRLSSELIDIQNKIEEIDDELFDAADNISEKLA